MQTFNPTPTDPESAPPERGRIWRIVIIVLALHAALLGSVVLIQGCGSKEAPAVSMNEALDASKSVEDKAAAAVVKEETNSVPNANIICPSAAILTPEEKLPGPEVISAEPSPSTIALQTETPKTETVAPKPELETAKAEAAPALTVAPAAPPSPLKYTVCKGDTLSRVAKKNKVSLQELAKLNKVSNHANLKIGQKLLIPFGGSNPAAVTEKSSAEKIVVSKAEKNPVVLAKNKSTRPALANKTTHVVKAGESLYSISRRYGVSMQSLMKVNRITDPRRVRVSQKLLLPSGKSGSDRITSRVEPGWQPVANKLIEVDEPDVAAPLEEPAVEKRKDTAAAEAAEPVALGEEVEGT